MHEIIKNSHNKETLNNNKAKYHVLFPTALHRSLFAISFSLTSNNILQKEGRKEHMKGERKRRKNREGRMKGVIGEGKGKEKRELKVTEG